MGKYLIRTASAQDSCNSANAKRVVKQKDAHVLRQIWSALTLQMHYKHFISYALGIILYKNPHKQCFNALMKYS
jgi:predicted NACHT family NTPase